MSKRAKSNSIRIIAGRWRGRRLPVLDSPGLRPTTDRVRETVFNWLMRDVVGAHCLDLYAGSGALGFESLSRGAAFVQFVESNAATANSIQNCIELLQVNESPDSNATAVLTAKDALAVLAKSSSYTFDIVFLDPPFQSDLLASSAFLLEKSGCLSSAAIIYVEYDSSLPTPQLPPNWQQYKSGCAGQSAFYLYRREPAL